MLAVKEPTVTEMKEAVDDERKITLHEEKFSGSDGHAEVLYAGRVNPSVREDDELGGGAFKGTIRPSGAPVAQTTSFGVLLKEKRRPRHNDGEPRQDTDAEEDCKTNNTAHEGPRARCERLGAGAIHYIDGFFLRNGRGGLSSSTLVRTSPV